MYKTMSADAIKHDSRKLLYLQLVLGILCALTVAPIYGQTPTAAPAKPPAPPATPTIEPAPTTNSLGVATSGGFLKEWKPQAGLLLKPMFSTGANFAEVMNPGYASFVIHGEVIIPKKYVDYTKIPLDSLKLEARGAFTIGYASFLSKDQAESSAIRNDKEVHMSTSPWMAHLFVSRYLNLPVADIKARPYTGLGFGMAFSGSSATSATGQDLGSAGSVDAVFSFTLGSGFQVKQIKMVEFLFQLDYTHLFESIDGNFIGVALGATYKF